MCASGSSTIPSIREASDLDRSGIRSVYMCAFAEGENRLVAALADDLLSEDTHPRTFGLVAETGGEVVGHVAFSPVTTEAQGDQLGYILAPLGVKRAHQHQGLGARLVESGMKQLQRDGAQWLFVYGDPGFYARFGFDVGKAGRFLAPYTLKYPHGWQAMTLNPGKETERSVELTCVASLLDPALW